MGHSNIRTKVELAVNRSERTKRREDLKRRASDADSLLAFHNSLCDDEENRLTSKQEAPCSSTQTDLAMSDMENSSLEITLLRSEVKRLRKSQSSCYNEDSFKHDDEKVKFYTGLPSFRLLMTVFSFVSSCMSFTHRNVLSPFEEFISVLMRLRLNCSLQDVAFRFNISRPTAGRIFDRWINIMDIRLQHLIVWPDRDILRSNMPLDFSQAFGNKVAVIVDCFEVFIERPSSLISRAMTWSNYKHHNTVKFLIGITPQGVISYISKAWGGRVSDKYLTEHSSFLSNLLPGDIVLADRGFDISDSVGFYCAKLAIPAFTRGKSQLSALEVEETRKIANVRIHVERVIGTVRQKYQVLNGTLPMEMVTTRHGETDAPIDKIARVCCCLVNLCPSIMPLN